MPSTCAWGPEFHARLRGVTDADVVARFAAAYNAQRWEELAALCVPDVEFWTFLQGRAEPEALRGREGIRRWRQSEDEVLEFRTVEVREIEELAPSLLLVSGSVHGRFRGSGVDLRSEAAWLFEVRNSAVTSFRSFETRAAALSAARQR